MATILYGANVGYTLDQVVETQPGPAVTANNVELNVNLANTVTDSGASRGVYREEVLIILNLFMQKIIRDNWPPVVGEE